MTRTHPPAVPFEIVVGRHGTTQTLTVAGEVDLAVTERIAGDLRAMIAGGPETVVVELTALTFIDSSGIRVLIGAHQHALARDVHLVIVPPPAPVFRTFELCGVDTVLPFVAVPTMRG